MLYSPTIISIIEVLLVVVPVLLTVAFVTVAERKTMASMQRRLGPNIVGYYGLLQAFADALKLLLKEYICTKQETIKTGINIDTVRESKLKLHNTFSDSESTHLNNFTDTGALLIPTSIKASVESKVVIKTDEHVINWDPVTPIFLPKKPETIEPNRGNIIIVKYIT